MLGFFSGEEGVKHFKRNSEARHTDCEGHRGSYVLITCMRLTNVSECEVVADAAPGLPPVLSMKGD